MKNLFTVLAISLISFNSFSQVDEDFVIIDEVTENKDLVEHQLSEQSNVYITQHENVNTLEQISNVIKRRKIGDLHIYVASKPGVLIFKSNEIHIRNIDNYSNILSSWNKNITGEVVLHTKSLFNGLDGILLKHKLESITGLIFTTT